MREAELEMREKRANSTLFLSVSLPLRGSQPGKKKKLTRRRRRVETRTLEPAARRRGTGTRAKFERAEWRENKTEENKERGTERGSFVSPHPIDLHLVLA